MKNPGFDVFFMILDVLATTRNPNNAEIPHISYFGHFKLIWPRFAHFGPLCATPKKCENRIFIEPRFLKILIGGPL